MFGQTSGMSSPHAKTGKGIRISVSPQTVSFRSRASTLAQPKSFIFCLWGSLKPLVYLAPIEIKETLHQYIFMPLKPSRRRHFANISCEL